MHRWLLLFIPLNFCLSVPAWNSESHLSADALCSPLASHKILLVFSLPPVHGILQSTLGILLALLRAVPYLSFSCLCSPWWHHLHPENVMSYMCALVHLPRGLRLSQVYQFPMIPSFLGLAPPQQPGCLGWLSILLTSFSNPGYSHRLTGLWRLQIFLSRNELGWRGVSGRTCFYLYSKHAVLYCLLVLTYIVGLFGLDFRENNGNDVCGGRVGGHGDRQIGYSFPASVPYGAHCG